MSLTTLGIIYYLFGQLNYDYNLISKQLKIAQHTCIMY